EGRRALRAHALRATNAAPDFHGGNGVDLGEMSPTLRQRQLNTLSSCGVGVQWQSDIMDMPWGTNIIIANEFFDAMPVHQAVKVEGGWQERRVGLDGRRLVFVQDAETMWRRDRGLPARVGNRPPGARVQV